MFLRPRFVSTPAHARASVARGAFGAVGHEIEGLEQRAAAVVEATDRRQRTRAGEEKLDPLLCQLVRGLQAEGLSNQCAALAGASLAASSPASRRTATALASPSRAERST